MSDRIRELSEQALDIVSNKRMLKDGQLERTWDPCEYDQVFAELIVRECIEQLEIGKRCDPYTGELFVCERNADIDYEIAVLKEHFGVEE